MIVIGLDGNKHKLSLVSKPKSNASKPHIRARVLLKEMFPNRIIYEEITLKGSNKFSKKNLYADFFIPSEDLLIEVHGEQHYRKTFFHETEMDFIQAKANDARKKEWCRINEITYIELPSKESEDDWKLRIRTEGL